MTSVVHLLLAYGRVKWQGCVKWAIFCRTSAQLSNAKRDFASIVILNPTAAAAADDASTLWTEIIGTFYFLAQFLEMLANLNENFRQYS